MVSEIEVKAKLLNELGFSFSEARIYLLLTKEGVSTANEVAKEANMDRAQTYRQIAKLQAKGFVKKILGYPCKFEAIPTNQLLPILLQKKKEEILAIENKTKQILESTTFKETKEREKEFILFIPRLEMITEEVYREIRIAETSIDTLTTAKVMEEASFDASFAWEDALKKGVKMTFILEKPSKKNMIPRRIKELETRYPNFIIRYVSPAPKVMVVIEDNKEVWVKTSSGIHSQSSWLFSNNPFIIALARDYFDRILRDTMS
jgi:sugar-specific transcriptional regulator TrmB